MNIRVAQAKDRPTFIHLWTAFMTEHEKLGSDIRATNRSLLIYEELFLAYTTEKMIGCAILAYDDKQACGVLLWGQGANLPFDLTVPERVHAWGAWVAPTNRRQGISIAMRHHAAKYLFKRGIKEVMGSALIKNTGGITSSFAVGFVPTVISGYLPLNEQTCSESPSPGYWDGNITEKFALGEEW